MRENGKILTQRCLLSVELISNEVFEFMRISQDVIRDGAKIDDTNEEVALDENIFQLKVIALFIAL